MYQAKGWEFRIVFLAYCNGGYLPSYAEWNKTDERDHPAVERRYRRLLYTAITRAKEKLYVSWVGKPSRLLPTDSALRQ
jgi:superfamily I DNA/RNA helicase